MIKRVDLQLRVTRLMMEAVDLFALPPEQDKLRAYMFKLFLHDDGHFQYLPGTGRQRGSPGQAAETVDDLKAHDERLYRRCRHSVAQACNLPGWLGCKLSIAGYRIAQEALQVQLMGAAMQQYKTILFDLDGTLTDSAARHPQLGAPCLPAAGSGGAGRGHTAPVSRPAAALLLRDYLHLSETDVARAVAAFREYYPEKGIFENEVFPGIPALLHDLKNSGKTVVMATSKPEVFARRIMEHLRPCGLL